MGESHVNVHIANSGSKAIVVLSRHDAEPEAVCDDQGYGYQDTLYYIFKVHCTLTHPDRNTQNERKATQSNAKQRTQGDTTCTSVQL